MDRTVIRKALLDWGADRLEHPGGSLLDHLERTASLLESWGASTSLVQAGLTHAAYGTDGFPVALLSVEHRAALRSLIGDEAEAIVYQYASCDRRHLGTKLGTSAVVSFRNRFTGRVAELPTDSLRSFMELTFANELDVCAHNDRLPDEAGRRLLASWFAHCRHLVTGSAYAAFEASLGRMLASDVSE